MKTALLGAGMVAAALFGATVTFAAPPVEIVEEVLDVSPVWAAHPVGFALLTHKNHQFVAFYDDQRRMTIAARKLGDKTWTKTILPETTGWDSHNYIALAVDDNDCLHVSGNMHVVPLVYFRATRPLDVGSFERVKNMVGTNETRVTYPIFMRGASNAFLYTYRDGSSGNGDQIYNVYDHASRTWKRLLDKPLSDGEGARNAYFNLPQLGPDGLYHMVWVWRETPDAASNRDPSYARSRDLIHWEKSDGSPLALPITLAKGDIIDAVPVKGGLINGNVKLGWDREKRPIVTYHKYDARGNIQIYAARREASGWKSVQVSDWNWRWEFGGGGSIPFEVRVSPVSLRSDGNLTLPWATTNHGSGQWVLDAATLKPIANPPVDPRAPVRAVLPDALAKPASSFAEMQVLWAGDTGKSGETNVRYALRWETLGANRDQARVGALPPPSVLRLYKLRTPAR